jgi:hypothetical protein
MQQRADEAGPYSSIPGVDPYVDWAFGAGSAFFVVTHEGREWLPVLLQLNEISARDLARSEWAESLNISTLFTEPPAGLGSSTYCAALVTKEFFGTLLHDAKLKQQIVGVAVGPPLRVEAAAETSVAAPSKGGQP